MADEDDGIPVGASAVLRAVADLIHGEINEWFVEGTYRDHVVQYAHYDDNGAAATHVDVEVPLDWPFVIDLRRPAFDEVPTFQDTFVGVVAPLDVASLMLTRAVCEELVKFSERCAVRLYDIDPMSFTSSKIEDFPEDSRHGWRKRRWLRVEFRGWPERVPRAIQALDIAVSIVDRFPQALETANTAWMKRSADAAQHLYRGGVPVDETSLQLARKAELEAADRELAKVGRIWITIGAIVLSPFLLLGWICDLPGRLFKWLRKRRLRRLELMLERQESSER